MCGFKIGWIIPVIVFFVLFSVIGVGIYQINSNGNPWNFGGTEVQNAGWDFLRR